MSHFSRKVTTIDQQGAFVIIVMVDYNMHDTRKHMLDSLTLFSLVSRCRNMEHETSKEDHGFLLSGFAVEGKSWIRIRIEVVIQKL